MKVLFVFGTRPEFIKLQPLIFEAKKRNHSVIVVHSGQHFSNEMNDLILSELNIKAGYQINCGSLPRHIQISKMIEELPKIYSVENPDFVIAQGDTNTVFAAALSSNILNIKFVHVEAGIRSFDRTMPEEVNRVLVDQISDYLFAPTSEAVKNLKKSECSKKGIFLVGNTIVDAVLMNKKYSENLKIYQKYSLKRNEYCVLTMHRAENVDSKDRLVNILKGVKDSDEKFIFPIHPRTKKMISYFGLDEFYNSIPNIITIPALGFFEFLNLCSNSKLILSDSGGIQEEASIYKKPVLIIRDNTERPEILGTFGFLVGADSKRISSKVKEMFQSNLNLDSILCPYGDGTASKQIIDVLERDFR